jgi:hypothetical protein
VARKPNGFKSFDMDGVPLEPPRVWGGVDDVINHFDVIGVPSDEYLQIRCKQDEVKVSIQRQSDVSVAVRMDGSRGSPPARKSDDDSVVLDMDVLGTPRIGPDRKVQYLVIRCKNDGEIEMAIHVR